MTCPTIYVEFQKGSFVTQKTRHKFSPLASYQVHERLNSIVKGDKGGIVGTTESESALNRWTVGGPELARLLNEKYSADAKSQETHYEKIPGVQKKFFSHVQSVTDVIQDISNPFSEISTHLTPR